MTTVLIAQRGRKLLDSALMNEAVNGRERFNSLRNCAQRALARGQRDEALQWYAMLEKLPFVQAEERDRYLSQAWYEMGKIEESRGRIAQAKSLYRQAMERDGGEMRFRVRARDALESILYFE
jgi:tetratricopeptide (TPR) repeat protein